MGTYPCFYYSTYQGFTNLTVDSSQTDLTDTALWSQTAPEDLADVTAIAIDLRHKADGSAYTFAPEEVALCYVTMTAPANYWDYIDDPATAGDETARAYNSAYLQCTTTPVYGGTGSTAVEECAPVTVGLRSPDVAIHKTSDPASGTAAAPTVVSTGDAITYQITIENQGKAAAIYDLRIEDPIPAGLEVQTDASTYAFGDGAASPADGSGRVGVQQAGQQLVFTADKLDAGETLRLVIPVTVSNAAIGGMTFENTAVLAGFNGKTWPIQSETTYHKTIPAYELPETGGPGTIPLRLAGTAMLLTAVLASVLQSIFGRKRRKCA